ncbi:MAG: CocE/NonD family hydrolase [Ignavibacteriaceae bacterium]|nr:CocE/NonD family hydrolase [Ignavibacteriaceae bacterium]
MNNSSIQFYLFIIVTSIFWLQGGLFARQRSLINYSVKRYDFTVRMRDSVLIDCTKFIPVEKKPAKGWPVIMFCHGFSESKETEVPDAVDQAQFGYYTFVFTMRGQGHSGGLSNLISTVEMNDLMEIIDYIKRDPLADSTSIAIFGASQGGIIPFMAVCNGAKVGTVLTDLASPEFASSWIENGSIKITFFFTIDYDTSIVRYTNDVKKLRKWTLSKENDKWDSLANFLPKGRDFLDKVPECKVPVLITNAWQDKYFNASGMIKAIKLLKVPFMAYFGAVGGHGADTTKEENDFLSTYDNNWEEYWLNNFYPGFADSAKYQYASSHFPRVNNHWSFSHFISHEWPPLNVAPLTFYFNPGGKLLEVPAKTAFDTAGFWNDLIDTSFTMQQAINTSFKGEFFNKRFSKNTLVFETDPLPNDYQLIGAPQIHLFYSSTADVCQFNVQIWEIKPGLDTSFVTRINYTDRHYKPGLIKEKITEGTSFSHLFQQGDKIRIIFTNLDTQPADSFLTTNPYVLPILKKSYNKVYMGKSFPSFIELPMVGSTSGIAKNNEISNKFRLFQNYPNPFNSLTNIRFSVDKPAHVELRVYNKRGRKVATVLDDDMPAGTHQVEFNCSHKKLFSGVYFYEIKVGNTVRRMKMVLAN